MPTRPGGLDELGREPLHPSVYGHVIDGDAALGQQLLHVVVGQAVAQALADRDTTTSRGNRKPAKTDDELDEVTTSVSRLPRSANATLPPVVTHKGIGACEKDG